MENNIAKFIQQADGTLPLETTVPELIQSVPQTKSISMVTIGVIVIGILILIAIIYIVMKKWKNPSIDTTSNDTPVITTDKTTNDTIDMNKIIKVSDSFSSSPSLNDWKVYVSDYCGYCVKQKEVLKQYFPSFNDFDSNLIENNINSVPTWENKKTKKKYPGFKNIDALYQMINN